MADIPPEVMPKPKRGRKLKIQDQTRAERKRLANLNEEFINVKGEVKRPKIFVKVSMCCSQNCYVSFEENEQLRIFELFHSLGSYESRALFLAYNIRSVLSKFVSRTKGEKVVLHTYMLNEIHVCKKFFYDVLQVNPSRGYLALDKFKKFDIRDHRGIFPHPKLSPDREEFAVNFLMAIPRYVSHYNNNRTTACYFGCEWDESKLYRAYSELWKENNSEIQPMALTTFNGIFHRYNFKFHPRTVDRCKFCDIYKAREKRGEDVTEIHQLHLNKARVLREALNRDFERSKIDETFEAITIDFEKTHIYPKLETSIVYYLRKLSLLNFGIHSGKTGQAYFFPWLETEAGRGADEVGTCLSLYINEHVKAPVKELVIVGDSCGGQNRNFKICMILSKILSEHPSLESIEIRYLQSGHSYLPNDRDFAHFQKLVNKQDRIELVSEYIRLMKECHVNAEKINVTPMNHQMFISSDPLKEIVCHRKYSITKVDYKMMKVHQIKIERCKPSLLFLKYDITTEEEIVVDIRKRLKGPDIDWSKKEFGKKQPRSITVAKMKDLLKQVPLLYSEEARQFILSLVDLPNRDMLDDIDVVDALEEEELEELYNEQ